MSGINKDRFTYNAWIHDALRGVLRRALETLVVAQEPGEHHFYVNFRTTDPNVSIPGFLKAQYPEEITVVLQHQFEDLFVDESGFEVTLSFSGQRHRLVVPFAAVTSFADPSVDFSLQVGPQTMGELDAEASDGMHDNLRTIAPSDNFGKASELGENTTKRTDQAAEGSSLEDQGDGERDENAPDGGADVISIEAFRNK